MVLLGDGNTFKRSLQASTLCFANIDELKQAIDEYVEQECNNVTNCIVGGIYGWPMDSWCVTNITDMSHLFSGMINFNENISSWDVSNVILINAMFFNAQAFNRDNSGWDVAHVTDMSYMFYGAQAFNGDISGWDVSGVMNMAGMFSNTYAFNGNISRWNVTSVTDMHNMFYDARAFNQNLCSWADKFPYNNSLGIFTSSNCTFKDDPKLEQGGPFCASNCIAG